MSMSSRRAAFWKRWADERGSVECWYCGRPVMGPDATSELRPEIEHQHPVSLGGRDDDSNCVPACHKCNAEKGTRTLREYRCLVFEKRQRALAQAFDVVQLIDADYNFPFGTRWVSETERIHLHEWIAELAIMQRNDGVDAVRFAGEEWSPRDLRRHAEWDAQDAAAATPTASAPETMQ